MDLLANANTSLVLVNLVFAALALAIGFAAGAWICGAGASTSENESADATKPQKAKEAVLDEERTAMATDRLRDLASAVASDVGEHNESIGRIEASLAGAKDEAGGVSSDIVERALTQITAANEQLQSKLAKAEQQIEAQAEQIKTHESEARTDSLTQLANRRAFDDELKRRLSEWNRQGTPFSLLILDVDHFKKFNDTHGHQAGDEVLRRVAEALTECAREMDLPCRYGGEEFAVVMPATSGEDGCPLAERVRKSVEAMTVPFEGKSLRVTTSCGLAGVGDGDDAASLIKRADDALYASKDAGRNNSHRHTGAECVPITPGLAAEQKSTPPAAEPASAGDTTDAFANRTRFMEVLREELRVAQSAAGSLAVMTAELAGYEELASEFGDAIAKLTADSVGQFLQNAIGDRDCLGRLTDGRFIVALPGQSAQEATDVGQRINAALAGCAVPIGDRSLRLETNIGVTAMTAEDSAVSLMQRAESPVDLAAI